MLIDVRILVTVENGIVTLSGEVKSLIQKQSAVDVAKQVAGIASLINNIQVKTDIGSKYTKSTIENLGIKLPDVDDNPLKISGA